MSTSGNIVCGDPRALARRSAPRSARAGRVRRPLRCGPVGLRRPLGRGSGTRERPAARRRRRLPCRDRTKELTELIRCHARALHLGKPTDATARRLLWTGWVARSTRSSGSMRILPCGLVREIQRKHMIASPMSSKTEPSAVAVGVPRFRSTSARVGSSSTRSAPGLPGRVDHQARVAVQRAQRVEVDRRGPDAPPPERRVTTGSARAGRAGSRMSANVRSSSTAGLARRAQCSSRLCPAGRPRSAVGAAPRSSPCARPARPSRHVRRSPGRGAAPAGPAWPPRAGPRAGQIRRRARRRAGTARSASAIVDAIAAMHEPGAGRERRRDARGRQARTITMQRLYAFFVVEHAARRPPHGGGSRKSTSSLRSVLDWGKTRATGMLARPRQRR